jgi:signal transduction histidine kinase
MSDSGADEEQADILRMEAQLEALGRDNLMLRETLDAIGGTIVVFGPQQEFLYGNRGYFDMFPHLVSNERLAGLRYGEVLALSIAAGTVLDPRARQDKAAFIAAREEEIKDRSIASREIHNPANDKWAQIRTTWAPSGNRISLRVDITALKRLQLELQRAQRLETIGRISAGVAHDFNNLLTVIVSNLEMMQMRQEPAVRVRAMAASALRASEAGARLVRQLLTFARRDVTNPELLDPNALLSGMADLLRRTVVKSITLALELGENVGQSQFDASQFESAIMNLVLNARDAVAAKIAAESRGESGRITITTTRAGDMIAVRVSDTGIGMAADVAAQAFEPFFTTKPIGAGSGLGLSQVYGFATGIGGDAHIDSVPGDGTTVTLLLPITQEPG